MNNYNYIPEQEEYIDQERLKNKTLEPERRDSKHVNRNLQLGKIEPHLLQFYFHKVDRLNKYEEIPNKFGGFVTKDLAKLGWDTINSQFVMSGSSGGFVREINATDRKINDNRYSEVKLGRFGRMRKEN